MDGLKKFVQMRESPYHGLNFCVGTVGEMLDDPRTEINDAIRWFGERGKIFNIHFRNIKGRKLSFMESFPDEGDMDMWGVIKLLAELDYKYMVMPDHVPHLSGPWTPAAPATGDYRTTLMPDHPQHGTTGSNDAVAFAYCFGYIRAQLQILKETYPDRIEL